MAVKVRVEQSPLKVRVGQSDAIKILSSAPIGSKTVENVVGGIADVTALNVSGISTFAGNINSNGNIVGDNETNISGISSVTATSFFGDGSGLTNTGAVLSAASGSQRLILSSLTSGIMVSAATDADLTFNATSNLLSTGKLLVSGITTFSDDVVFTGANTNARWNHSTSDLTLFDNTRLVFGNNEDFQIWHGGAHTFLKNTGGDLRIRGDKILLKRADDSERYLEANVNQGVKLFFNGVEKCETTVDGLNITGDANVTGTLTAGLIDGGSF